MAVTSKQKTVLTILVGAIVTIAPAFFTYLQAVHQIDAKREESHAETKSGYEELVASVKALQKTALDQHDYIVKLEGQIEMLVSVVAKLPGPPNPTGLRMTTPPSLPTIEPSPARPELPAPANFDLLGR